MKHSAADIIRQLLIDLNLGTMPRAKGGWPIHLTSAPPGPDSIILILDDPGIVDAREQTAGNRQELYGFRLWTRSLDPVVGFERAWRIKIALDQLTMKTVAIDGTDYRISAVGRRCGLRGAGREPNSKRRLFVVSGILLSIRVL